MVSSVNIEINMPDRFKERTLVTVCTAVGMYNVNKNGIGVVESFTGVIQLENSQRTWILACNQSHRQLHQLQMCMH